LHVSEGDTVEVGTPIISVETAPGAPTTVKDAPAQGAVEPGIEGSPAPKVDPSVTGAVDEGSHKEKAPAGSDEEIEEGKIGGTTSTGRTAVLVGYGVKQTEAVRRPRKGAPAAGAAPAAGVAPAVQAASAPPAQEARATPAPAESGPAAAVAREGGARALAKPPVRKYAKDLGVDLDAVTGSGEGGIISRADVDAHANGASTSGAQADSAGSATSATTTAPAAYQAPVFTRGGERETRVPIKGVRKMTAQAMVGSAFTAPHVTEWVTIDATATMELVERLKKDREFKDVKVTPLLVLAKAMAVAIRRHPEINATWDEDAQEIVVKHYLNLGIAAATPRGLIVPNIKDADQMSMLQLAEAIGALTATAREGRTQPADMSGGTMTITNVGVFGVDTGTPIINPGEAAIMAFGAIRRQPWVVTAPDGTETIEPRWVTQLALSFDHRLVDGELGSKFIADVGAILADPARGLVWG
ncbi:MAG: dihydrolipoamide acetyltransferase family protein, partial [Pedococcus sp.]